MENRFTRPQKVRFEHIDFAGIVFYPRFLEMLNALVEDWFEEALGYPFIDMHGKHGIPTVNLEVAFRKPARLGEVLQKSLWIEKLGGSSLVCGFEFRNASHDICVQGKVTLVFVSILEGRDEITSTPIIPELRTKMEQYLLKN